MQFAISNRYEPSEVVDKILINNQFRLEQEEKKKRTISGSTSIL